MADERVDSPTSALAIIEGASTTGLLAGLPDADGDGVPDDSDQCPGEDDTVDVDADGIPDCIDPLIDSDGDGVADDVDVCANTPVPDTASEPLLPNHYHTVDADGDGSLEWVGADGTVLRSLADTGGCSLSQVAPPAVLSTVHLRYGVTAGQLDAWLRLLGI